MFNIMEGIQDFINMMLRFPEFFGNFALELWQWRQSLILFTTIAGFALVITAIIRLTRKQGQGLASGNLAAFAGTFITAILLINIKQWIAVLTWSTFRKSSEASIFVYDAIPSDNTPEASLITFAMVVIMLTGLYSILKGTWMFKTLSNGEAGQKASLGSAIVHCLGGVIAVNITNFF